MSDKYNYDHYKSVPDPASNVNYKKKPKLIAVVDEDNCTGSELYLCPVDCIEPVQMKNTIFQYLLFRCDMMNVLVVKFVLKLVQL